MVGTARICTRLALARFFASILADGTPVLAKDFSQSCGRGPTHVAFHEGQTRAAGATSNVGARRTRCQILQADGAYFIHLVGMTPDVDKALLPHVSGGKRELDTGKNLTIG